MPVEKYKENEKDYIYFKIRMKDALAFVTYDFKIKKRLKENKTISLRDYTQMMNLLSHKDIEKEVHNLRLVGEISNKAITFFTKPRMAYDFTKNLTEKAKDIPDSDWADDEFQTSFTLSLKHMIHYPIRIALECFETDANKETCIGNCYKMIDDYTKQHKDIRKLYSHYKISVIAGYLAWRFNFKIGKGFSEKELEGKDPTTDQLYNAVKHCTEPYNTYPKVKGK